MSDFFGGKFCYFAKCFGRKLGKTYLFSANMCEVCVLYQIFPTTLVKFKMKIKQVLKKH